MKLLKKKKKERMSDLANFTYCGYFDSLDFLSKRKKKFLQILYYLTSLGYSKV